MSVSNVARVSKIHRPPIGTRTRGVTMGWRCGSPPSNVVMKPVLPVSKGTGFTSSFGGAWAPAGNAKRIESRTASRTAEPHNKNGGVLLWGKLPPRPWQIRNLGIRFAVAACTSGTKREPLPQVQIGWPPFCCQLKYLKLCCDGYFLFGASTVCA